MIGYLYILGTVFFTVYGQLVLKWRISQTTGLPPNTFEKIVFLIKLLFDPWIFSGFLAAFIASLFWMAAMTKFELSYVYPFMSSAFVLVFLLSIVLFHETITIEKTLGLTLIVLGIFVSSMSI